MNQTKVTIQNAIVREANIDMERDTFLTVWLRVDHSDGSQGFGGWTLGGAVSDEKESLNHDSRVVVARHHKQPNRCAEFISQCMRICGVSTWKHCIGKPIRVRIEDGKITGIGHFLKEEWFLPTHSLQLLTDKFNQTLGQNA